MPSGVGVVETFKSLIRHGKAHQGQRQDKPDADLAPPEHHQPHQQQRQHRVAPQKERDHPDQYKPHREPKEQKKTADYAHEAEMIVQEERQAKNNVPQYKGLERYRILEKMGDGAFSNVYKAQDLTTGQKVAIKVVRKFELNSQQRANILKEVQIMRGIDHPSIVKFYAFSESAEHYYLVLELMGGGELFHQIVKLTYFSENLARHVILQVAHGIRYMHEERGVVHRDIKPENLLFERIPIAPSRVPPPKQFDEEKEDEGEFIPNVGGGGIGKVKIADFGLSKIVWDEQTMTPCGTVGYTAPEIVKDERYSKSVDMWALGCVLYTLLCGFPPFYDESINVLTEKVARGKYTFLSPWWDNVSASAKDLITHLLCVDPKQRYTIDEFLQHEWCLAGTTEPPPPTPVARHIDNAPLDSPLLQAYMRGGRDGRSPGVSSLKEAFDITYAVHRMEEEGAHRRGRGRDRHAAGGRWLPGLNEEDEGDEDQRLIQEVRRKHGEVDILDTSIKRKGDKRGDPRTAKIGGGTVKPGYDGRAGQRDLGRKVGTPFELDMQAATLLGRRSRKAAGGIGSPLTQPPLFANTIETPGSPMQVT